jgi:putative methyltransferase (TIGR04325 family)
MSCGCPAAIFPRGYNVKVLPMATVTDIYADYATALASCGPGYHDADIADVIAFKTAQRIEPYAVAPEQALNSIIAVGIAAADIRNRQLNVLDFGGGCGFHYLRVATATRTPLRWAIVETETMAARATKLAQNYFRVFTTIGDAAAALGTVDLIHASSSIQYVPDPPAILKDFVALRPRYILLARLPLWREPAIVGVQVSPLSHNGIGPMPPNMQDREIRYPVTFMNIDEILRIFDGYDVVLTIDAPSSFYVVGDKSVPCVSIILRAKWA